MIWRPKKNLPQVSLDESEDKLNRLLVPVIAIILLSFVMLFLFVSKAISQADNTAAIASETALKHHLQAEADSLARLAEDNAWWDEAYEKLVLSYDEQFLLINAQETTQRVDVIDATFLYGADNTIMFEYSDNNAIPADDLLSSGLSRYMETLRVQDNQYAVTKAAFIAHEGNLYLAGFSLVQSGGTTPVLLPNPERRPALAFIRKIDMQTLFDIGDRLNIRNLRFDEGPDIHHVTSYQQAMPITTLGGADRLTFGTLNLAWIPNTPGTDLLSDLSVPIVAFAALLLLVMGVFFTNARAIVASERRANKIKSGFVANMSHEIRTPLNSIIGYSEFLNGNHGMKIEDDTRREYIGIIHQSGIHLLSIVNDILDLSKLEAGQYEACIEPTGVQGAIEDVINVMTSTASQKNVALEFGPGPYPVIHSDGRMLRQILMNIISNAIKFSPDNSKIKISVTEHPDHVDVAVEDHGVGMTSEELSLAMTKFGQVQSHYTRHHEGTGLGLPLVSKMVNLLGGKMRIMSKSGLGTTVLLAFPR